MEKKVLVFIGLQILQVDSIISFYIFSLKWVLWKPRKRFLQILEKTLEL